MRALRYRWTMHRLNTRLQALLLEQVDELDMVAPVKSPEALGAELDLWAAMARAHRLGGYPDRAQPIERMVAMARPRALPAEATA